MWKIGLAAGIVFSIAVSTAYAAPPPPAWSGNANLFLGGKFLDSADWSPAEDQVEGGLLLDLRPPYWPVNLAADFLFGFSSGLGLDVEIDEYDLGVRKIFDADPRIHPYIGGGLSIVSAEISGPGGSVEDTGAGVWIGRGLYATISEHFNIGVDLRLSTANVTFFGVDGDAGGVHIGVITGYHW
jgi:hypothetical protein